MLAAADCAAAADPVAPVAAETTEPAADVAAETGLPVPEPWAGLADGRGAAVVAGLTLRPRRAEAAPAGAGAADPVSAEWRREPPTRRPTCAASGDPAACGARAGPGRPSAESQPSAGGRGGRAEPVLAAAGWAGAADPVVPVTGRGGRRHSRGDRGEAEVADAVTADVTGASADVGESAACACRDSPSKTATTPIVKIVTCTARRAMCRNSGWDTRAPARSGEAARPDFPRVSSSKPACATFCRYLSSVIHREKVRFARRPEPRRLSPPPLRRRRSPSGLTSANAAVVPSLGAGPGGRRQRGRGGGPGRACARLEARTGSATQRVRTQDCRTSAGSWCRIRRLRRVS